MFTPMFLRHPFDVTLSVEVPGIEAISASFLDHVYKLLIAQDYFRDSLYIIEENGSLPSFLYIRIISFKVYNHIIVLYYCI